MTLQELLEIVEDMNAYSGEIRNDESGQYICFPFATRPTVALEEIRSATPSGYSIEVEPVNDKWHVIITSNNQ